MITPDDDVRMMADPSRWPHQGILPVKRHSNGELELGFVLADHGSHIYLGDFLEADPTDLPDFKDYDSFEHAVVDGWMVD